ncbi:MULTISPECIES: diacylglycerol kinase [unclassified Streptomyces]|uniref:diacylglycerol kinase n=1 Tax=unclassified Streptomyces TaxID=2593676 RepID=UPI0016615593|nr:MULTISPECIES: diacylglycerol kinase [unclassified Streptomyces]MBD0712249.1 sphingosine kinase [Streptomyces sp. CBMA291]MBD0714081.1 sphingosine kinase [Streptomyces sp. CBMA370]
MTSDITLFVNPTAGRGRGARAARPAAEAFRDAGFRVRVLLGHDAADALRRAREAVAEGTGALVAVGGDGMISLALQAVAGTDTPLGIVAAGTGNDFARTLGLPLGDPVAAARVTAETLRTTGGSAIDLGRIEGGTRGGRPGTDASPLPRWYGTVLASGFDSRVNDRGNRMRLPAGRFKYDLAILAELAAFRPVPYRLSFDDGRVLETEATLVAVGNGTSYGGGMRICADARPDDGLLDVTVVGDCDRRTLVKVFPRVYRGTHLGHPVVTTHRVRSVTLDAPGTTGYADGEPLGPLPLTVTCAPGALRILAPLPARNP